MTKKDQAKLQAQYNRMQALVRARAAATEVFGAEAVTGEVIFAVYELMPSDDDGEFHEDEVKEFVGGLKTANTLAREMLFTGETPSPMNILGVYVHAIAEFDEEDNE